MRIIARATSLVLVAAVAVGCTSIQGADGAWTTMMRCDSRRV